MTSINNQMVLINLAVDQHITINNRKLLRLYKYTTNSFLAFRKFSAPQQELEMCKSFIYHLS